MRGGRCLAPLTASAFRRTSTTLRCRACGAPGARLRLAPTAARLACGGRARMPGLVDGDARAARKRDLSDDSPPGVVRLRAGDVPLPHRRDEAGDVRAHQME